MKKHYCINFLARRRRGSNIWLTCNSGPKGLAWFVQETSEASCTNHDNRNCQVEPVVRNLLSSIKNIWHSNNITIIFPKNHLLFYLVQISLHPHFHIFQILLICYYIRLFLYLQYLFSNHHR